MSRVFVFDSKLRGRILFGGLLHVHTPDWAVLAVGTAHRRRGGGELEVILEWIATRDRQPGTDDFTGWRRRRLGGDSHGNMKSFGQHIRSLLGQGGLPDRR